jgi:hypothetical protein
VSSIIILHRNENRALTFLRMSHQEKKDIEISGGFPGVRGGGEGGFYSQDTEFLTSFSAGNAVLDANVASGHAGPVRGGEGLGGGGGGIDLLHDVGQSVVVAQSKLACEGEDGGEAGAGGSKGVGWNVTGSASDRDDSFFLSCVSLSRERDMSHCTLMSESERDGLSLTHVSLSREHDTPDMVIVNGFAFGARKDQRSAATGVGGGGGGDEEEEDDAGAIEDAHVDLSKSEQQEKPLGFLGQGRREGGFSGAGAYLSGLSSVSTPEWSEHPEGEDDELNSGDVTASDAAFEHKPSFRVLIHSYMRRERLHRATGMVLLAVQIYMFFFWVCGSVIMWGILSLYPAAEEMELRGYSTWWVAVFMTSTGFNNCGFTLTSDSMIPYIRQPGVYIWLGILVIAGNTGLPILLRGLLKVLHCLSSACPLLDTEALRFALKNPRLVTHVLFDSRQTVILVVILVCINVTEFVVFYISCLFEKDNSPFTGLDRATAVGISVAKTITIRAGGVEFVDPHLLSTGMIVVYMISMYLSSAPFVSRMYVSEVYIDHTGLPHSTDEGDASTAWNRFSKNFLFRHSIALILAVITCAFFEDTLIQTSSIGFFDIQFEIVSAYGNVGTLKTKFCFLNTSFFKQLVCLVVKFL